MMKTLQKEEILRLVNFASLAFGLFIVARGIYAGWNQPIGALGQPMGMDFFCFWSAGRFALEGRALELFDAKLFTEYQASYFKTQDVFLPWFYPPLLLLYICCFFALFPYKVAYLIYLTVSAGAFYCLARRLFPSVKPLYIIAFPAFWQNLMSGQNGLLTAIILIMGLVYLVKSGFAAGLILSLMSYKPQLCAAIPLYLLFERKFRAIISGIAGFSAVVAISTAIWGFAIWPAFFEGLRDAQIHNHGDKIAPAAMAYLFGPLQVLGFDRQTALLLNYVFVVACAVGVIRLWLKSTEADVKNSGLILLTLLLSPHLLAYDLVVTGAVIVWLWPRENLRPALMVLWLAPALGFAFGTLGIPLFPAAAAAILVQLNRDLRQENTVAAMKATSVP